MACLHADENFPYPAVEVLRRLGHDVLTAGEAGRAGLGLSDEDVLDFAHAAGRAVLTHNRKHFRKPHNAGHPHCGLVLRTEDPDFDALAARIDQILPNVRTGGRAPSRHPAYRLRSLARKRIREAGPVGESSSEKCCPETKFTTIDS